MMMAHFNSVQCFISWRVSGLSFLALPLGFGFAFGLRFGFAFGLPFDFFAERGDVGVEDLLPGDFDEVEEDLVVRGGVEGSTMNATGTPSDKMLTNCRIVLLRNGNPSRCKPTANDNSGIKKTDEMIGTKGGNRRTRW
eukprot:TRINITY_DN60331_c0_g2_i1.p2 TRINITY_DN60331_c0_g2~~TRINITY_DN60331_c0_g2_i1.p2  ORF type:complete len:138 (-),score=7.07 TRINITY_DN60331_c0_g2_i1:123-536(-)